MKISEVMTSQVVTAPPTATVQQVARTMSEIESGIVPIVQEGRVVGLVTDRDIVLRVVAEGGDINSPVSTIMSGDVQSCREDDNVADAVAKMGSHAVRRLVVYNEGGKLCGIVSLGDIAIDYGAKAVGHTLEEISAEPPTAH